MERHHKKNRYNALLLLVLLAHLSIEVTPWAPSRQLVRRRQHRFSTTSLFDSKGDKGSNPLDFILNPYESKIPAELKDEIYRAESNTDAAKDRSKRIALYAILAFVGILCAFFNGFLTELRQSETVTGEILTLDEAGFGWVESNPLTQFLFMNKIGGGLCLLGGAGAGLLAEAEFDTRRTNAERIFEELERRRAAKEKKTRSPRKKKKRRSGKETKRLEALSEVVLGEQTQPEPSIPETVVPEKKQETSDKDQGIIGTVKGFYKRADAMAASQALLLNKKLEDEGILEKVTDESGLKVIGKEAAAELKDKKDNNTKQ